MEVAMHGADLGNVSGPDHAYCLLLTQCKPRAARNKEEREWFNDRPVGKELT
jgi:hypothetical protein